MKISNIICACRFNCTIELVLSSTDLDILDVRETVVEENVPFFENIEKLDQRVIVREIRRRIVELISNISLEDINKVYVIDNLKNSIDKDHQ